MWCANRIQSSRGEPHNGLTMERIVDPAEVVWKRTRMFVFSGIRRRLGVRHEKTRRFQATEHSSVKGKRTSSRARAQQKVRSIKGASGTREGGADRALPALLLVCLGGAFCARRTGPEPRWRATSPTRRGGRAPARPGTAPAGLYCG